MIVVSTKQCKHPQKESAKTLKLLQMQNNKNFVRYSFAQAIIIHAGCAGGLESICSTQARACAKHSSKRSF